MKNKILLILLLAPFMNQAQQSHLFGNNEWLNSEQRNEQLRKKLIHGNAKLLDNGHFLIGSRTDTINLSNSNWVAADSVQYLYNIVDSTLASYNKLTNDPDSGWITIVVIYYFYDADKRDTSELVQSYDEVNEVWVNQSRTTYVYDINGNVVDKTNYSWDIPSSSWIKSSEDLWNYDSNFNALAYTYLDWGISDTLFQFLYTYDGNNNVSTETIYAGSPDLMPSNLTTYYYNAAQVDTQRISKYWNTNNSTWKNLLMDTLVYDVNNNLLSFSQYLWKNSAGAFILTDAKVEYSYDLTNKLIKTENYYGDGASSFILSGAISYEYDLNDNLDYELTQTYNSTSQTFENLEQTFFYYADILSGIHPATQYINDFGLYPNPADQSLVLQIESAKDEGMEMKVFDQSGRFLKSQLYSVKNGENKYSLDISDLDSGVYLIEFSNSNHETVLVQRFVKQ